MNKAWLMLAATLLIFSTAPRAAVLFDTGPPNNARWPNSDLSNPFRGQAADDFRFGGWAWAYNTNGDDPDFVGDATHRWIREGGDWTRFDSSSLAFSVFGKVIDVPEPPPFALVAAGLAFLGFARSRRAG